MIARRRVLSVAVAVGSVASGCASDGARDTAVARTDDPAASSDPVAEVPGTGAPTSGTPTADSAAESTSDEGTASAADQDSTSSSPPPTDPTGDGGGDGDGDDRDDNSGGAGTTGAYTTCWSAPADGRAGDVSWSDVTDEYGLVDPLIGMRGHAAAWGDLSGNGVADLVVGTFATARPEVYVERGATDPAPDAVLAGTGQSFEVVADAPEQYGRTSGAAIVDLDGDGALDVVLSRNVNGRRDGAPTAVFANRDGRLVEVDSGIDPELAGRSIGVLDIDGDGLLDLVILEDRYLGGSSQMYRNLGDFRFDDVTGSSGFPEGVHGLGVAVADVDLDGRSDVFVAGSNRLFLGTGNGLTEAPGVIPEWEVFGNEDDVSGAAFADVDRDGRLDLVVGHHFNSTQRGDPVPVRLYLNSTTTPGEPRFDDVTERVGLTAIPTKAPHVELADIDNDGWPDIVTSASARSGAAPAIFRHQGLDDDGLPRFATPAGLGDLQYWVSTPTADVDRDGRLDLLAVEWEPSLPSILFRNDTPSGHWLGVSVGDAVGGVGARVEVYDAGGAGDPDALVGAREITATVGYTAGVELHAHVGLGERTAVDVVVTPAGAAPITLPAVPADQHIRLGPCRT